MLFRSGIREIQIFKSSAKGRVSLAYALSRMVTCSRETSCAFPAGLGEICYSMKLMEVL